MPVTRPLTRQVLGRLFLKTLHEHKRPGGRHNHEAWNTPWIVERKIAADFGLGQLTQEEIALAYNAVADLERGGFIMQDPSQSSPEFKALTEKGKQHVEQSLDSMRLSMIDLDELLSREELRSKVRDDFISGEHESAVMKAFKMVEEAVRAKAGLTPNEHGRDLFARAFGGRTPLLAHPDAQTASETESLFFLFTGAYGWFRNPASHRSVTYANDQQAAHILAFANLLLDMIDQCTA